MTIGVSWEGEDLGFCVMVGKAVLCSVMNVERGMSVDTEGTKD